MRALTVAIISALALTTYAGRALGPRAHAAPAAQNVPQTFTWSMAKRFGPKRFDGIVDYHWDGAKYETKYVNPAVWKVDFDACVPDVKPNTEFALEVNGIAVANPPGCKFSHEFDKQGTYAVTIKLTNAGTTIDLPDTVTIKDLLIVSLGDSFASGQGNPDLPKDGSTPAQWIDQPCARSAKAGPALAAMQLEDADPHSSVTFLSYACTGAKIEEGILKSQGAIDPQMDRLEHALDGRAIDALLISAGGNDLGFADLVTSCILHKDCSTDAATVTQFFDGLKLLEPRYLTLSERISKLPSVKNVFITEYPDLVRDEDGDPCGGEPDSDPLRFISSDESEWASGVVISGLNQEVSKAATLHNWKYVTGISQEFRKHGFCTGKNVRWVRTYRDARKIQGADGACDVKAWTTRETIKACLISSGTFHPNEEGHKAYASALVAALRKAGLIAAPGS